MQHSTNPFKSKNPFVHTTHLLNYGQQHLTMFHQLKKNPGTHLSPQSFVTQATILNRKRKQLYEVKKQKQKEKQQFVIQDQQIQEEKKRQTFMKTISGAKSCKLLRNPYAGSYNSVPFGQQQKKKEETKKNIMSMNTNQKKKMVRHQIGNLKQQISRMGGLKKNEPNTFSVSKLYREKKGIYIPRMAMNIMESQTLDEQFTISSISTALKTKKQAKQLKVK